MLKIELKHRDIVFILPKLKHCFTNYGIKSDYELNIFLSWDRVDITDATAGPSGDSEKYISKS